jgi:hypothetical protein
MLLGNLLIFSVRRNGGNAAIDGAFASAASVLEEPNLASQHRSVEDTSP